MILHPGSVFGGPGARELPQEAENDKKLKDDEKSTKQVALLFQRSSDGSKELEFVGSPHTFRVPWTSRDPYLVLNAGERSLNSIPHSRTLRPMEFKGRSAGPQDG